MHIPTATRGGPLSTCPHPLQVLLLSQDSKIQGKSPFLSYFLFPQPCFHHLHPAKLTDITTENDIKVKESDWDVVQEAQGKDSIQQTQLIATSGRIKIVLSLYSN